MQQIKQTQRYSPRLCVRGFNMTIYLEHSAHHLSLNSAEAGVLGQLGGHLLQLCGTESQTAAVITLRCANPLGRRVRQLGSQFVVQ